MLVLDTNNNFDFSKYFDLLNEIYKEVVIEFNKGDVSATIIFVDDETIHELNKNYREKDKKTDVLSFPLFDENDKEQTIGEVYISTEVAKEQAKSIGNTLEEEIYFLALHGLLHLIGYDHHTLEDESKMINRQKEILKKVGIRNG